MQIETWCIICVSKHSWNCSGLGCTMYFIACFNREVIRCWSIWATQGYDNTSLKGATRAESFPCSRCGRPGASRTSLHSHTRTHSGNPDVDCFPTHPSGWQETPSCVESVSILRKLFYLNERGILGIACCLLGEGININLELAAFYNLCKLLVTVTFKQTFLKRKQVWISFWQYQKEILPSGSQLTQMSMQFLHTCSLLSKDPECIKVLL